MSEMPKVAETNAKTPIDRCVIETARSMVRSDDHELPVLPEVSRQLMQLTGDVNCEPKDIVELFKR
jgi:hypothetical protein